MFHFINANDPLAKWDAIRDLTLDPLNSSYIAAGRLLEQDFGVPNDRLAFRLSVFNYVRDLKAAGHTTANVWGTYLGFDIFHILNFGTGHFLYQGLLGETPGRVIVDELYTNDHTDQESGITVTWQEAAATLTWCGLYLYQNVLPYVRDRWAVAVQHTQNDRGYDAGDIQTALSAIFGAEGIAAFEMYANREWYCNLGRDPWLEGYFKYRPLGTPGVNGFKWVWDTWPTLRPRLRVIMGVQDPRFRIPIDAGVIDPTDAPPRFMDRMFYVWKRYAYPTVISRANGGFGTYQWDAAVSGNERDLQFAAAWVYYVYEDQMAPRFTVPCPPP